MSAQFSDEELMSFADGEADIALANAIEGAIAKNKKLAERVALFNSTSSLAKDAFQDMGKWQPPQELLNKIKSGTSPAENVVAFVPKAANQNQRSFFAPTALAASVALLAGIGVGLLLNQQTAGEPSDSIAFGTIANPDIVAALGTLKSGEERKFGADRVQMIATFTDNANRLCREFEFDAASKKTFVTVTCQTNKTWDVVFTAAAPAAQSGYAPAGSRDAVDAFLQSIGASETLSPEREAEKLKQ